MDSEVAFIRAGLKMLFACEGIIINMKKIKKHGLLLLVLLLGFEGAYCPAAVFSSQRKSFELRILTGSAGGQWDALGGGIAEALSERGMFTTSRLGGAVANVDKVNRGETDLAFSITYFLGMADAGEGEAKRIESENVALLANIYRQVFYVLIRKDFAEKYDIDSVDDLLSRKIPVRFATLKPGTGSEFFLKMLLKYGYSLDYEQLGKRGWTVSFCNYSEIADNFANGELDCFAYTAGIDVPLISRMEEFIDLKLLAISKPVRDGLRKRLGIETYTIQPGAYKSVTRSIQTIGDYACLVVRKDLSEEVVYAISKALWQGRKKLEADVKGFCLSVPKSALKKGINVHPGAKRFWDENRN